jgi:hypothetical protein
MRLPRMTTRRWMVAVAVVGMVIAAGLMVARATRLARQHRQYTV